MTVRINVRRIFFISICRNLKIEEPFVWEIDPFLTPCLRLVRRTWADAQAVTFARFVHPGTRYRLACGFSGNTMERPELLAGVCAAAN
jgi:hypothetical protein